MRTDITRLRQLRRARDVLDRDWSQPIDMAALAASVGYSRYHFVRAFGEVYGETPGRYLSRRRIERAQDLLRTANLTVSEVCVLVGFGSLGTFCTRFREVTGMTPSRYRASVPPPPVPGCFVQLWAGGFAATQKKPAAAPVT